MNYNDSQTPEENFRSLFTLVSSEIVGFTGSAEITKNGLNVHLNDIGCEFGRSVGITAIDPNTNERIAYFEVIETSEEHLDALKEEDDYLHASEIVFNNTITPFTINGLGFDTESACRCLYSNLGGVA